MAWRSRLPELERRLEAGEREGLIAAAHVVKNAVQRKLRGGYTTGAFVTGRVINSVTLSDVMRMPSGNLGIKVGTNVDYALYWEIGHNNRYMRRFVRVEKWRPAAIESRTAAAMAFARAVRRALQGN